jgi:hypothetical protein
MLGPRNYLFERNYIKTDEDSVFTRSNTEFLLSFSIDQSFKRLSKLIRFPGMLENFNLAVNLNFFSFFKNMAWLELDQYEFLWSRVQQY